MLVSNMTVTGVFKANPWKCPKIKINRIKLKKWLSWHLNLIYVPRCPSRKVWFWLLRLSISTKLWKSVNVSILSDIWIALNVLAPTCLSLCIFWHASSNFLWSGIFKNTSKQFEYFINGCNEMYSNHSFILERFSSGGQIGMIKKGYFFLNALSNLQ